jgi:V/A-type H+-transporting ATPase subunit E
MSVEGIIDRIIADAEAEAKKIIDEAKQEASAIKEKGKKEAEEYYERQLHLIDEKYRREKERAILNKRLEQRKNMLQARQKWMDRAFQDAYKRLVDQPKSDYKDLLIALIKRVSHTKDEEVIFGKKGEKKILEEIVAQLNKKDGGNFTLSKERRDFTWGFVLKKGKVEINMSIDSLFKYKRADLEQKAWEIFNAGI